jgi:RNA polymerase sigma-70 factor (ECF subfamily)
MDEGESGLSAVVIAERAALVRFLAARTGDAVGAEDLFQELWLKVRQGADRPVGNPRAYLYRMAQNLVLDKIREHRRRGAREHGWAEARKADPGETGEPADSAPNAEDMLIARDEADVLARAIASLPEGAARVLRLHKIDGLSHAEVAARLGISRSGVEKHIAVAMAHLRKRLGA